MIKALVLLAQAFFLSAAAVATSNSDTPIAIKNLPPLPYDQHPTAYSVPLDSIVRIQCGRNLGTAEVINGNQLITASHVVGKNVLCRFTDSNTLVTVVHNYPDLDYAELRAATGNRNTIPHNCEGFKSGEVYLMIGFAHGKDFALQVVTALNQFSNLEDSLTKAKFTHVRSLQGKPAIPGMSGGPILNLRGEMVGTTLAAPTDPTIPLGYARELADTPLCRADK